MAEPVTGAAADEARRRHRYRETFIVTVVGSVIDLLLGLAKLVVGFVAHSQALIADGVHSLSDLATDFFVLYAAKHASREADEDHPYGHGRIETVATVALGVALILVAAGLAVDAVLRLRTPEKLLVPEFAALVVAAISIVSKEAIYHYTMYVARKYRSKMLQANAWHSRSDAISSVVVLVGVGGAMLGVTWLDAVAAVGVAGMIAKIGWDLAWHGTQELVDKGLEPEEVERIRRAILGVDGVRELHLLRTRRMGPDVLVDVHIQVDPRLSVSEGHHISEAVRSRLVEGFDEVADVMVHIDPENDEDGPCCKGLPLRRELRDKLAALWGGIPEAARIRDMHLHYLGGKVYVDLVLPAELVENDPGARARLARRFDEVARQVDEVAEIRLLFH